MDARGKATAPGGALGFGRRDRVVAKLCLLAFIELDGDAHRTGPHRVGRRFGKRFSKERHNLDAELLLLLAQAGARRGAAPRNLAYYAGAIAGPRARTGPETRARRIQSHNQTRPRASTGGEQQPETPG